MSPFKKGIALVCTGTFLALAVIGVAYPQGAVTLVSLLLGGGGGVVSSSNPLPVTGTGGTFPITGTTSNASSGVATSATNLPAVAYLYVFNGTTWDQLSSLTVGTKHSLTAAIVDGSGNQITTFGAAAVTSNASSGVATSSTNQAMVGWLYGFNGATWDQLQVDASKNLKVIPQASQSSLGNVGAINKKVCFNPTVTNSTYAANVVMGGLFTAANLLTSTGAGTIQSVELNFTTAQTVAFKLYYFESNPSNSTWTDHSAAAVNATDALVVGGFVSLANPDSGLAAATTTYSAIGLGIPYSPAGTSGYFILVPNATTASLGATTNAFNICVTVLQNS